MGDEYCPACRGHGTDVHECKELESVVIPRRDLVWLLLWASPAGCIGPERAAHIATAAGIDLLAEAERP